MQIKCSIANKNSAGYSKVTLEKLYQVIFWDENFKRFDIYSGVVLRGKKSNGDKGLDHDFNVEISFETNSQVEDGTTIHLEDITDKFTSQKPAWKAVWGKESSMISSPDEFKEIYSNAFHNSVDFEHVYNKDVICLKENNKATIAYKASININDECKINIGCNKVLPQNVNVYTWLKTSVSYKKRTSANFEYVLEKAAIKCNDFSFYIVLPMNHDIKDENIKAIIDDRLQDNPFQKIKGKELEDGIYFNEWIREHNIVNKLYYRCIKPDSIKGSEEKLTLEFEIQNYVNPVIKQFLYALLISLFFSFSLDQTRLMHYKWLINLSQYLAPDINILLTYAPLAIGIILKFNYKFLKDNTSMLWINRIGILFSFGWFIFLYGYSSIQFYNSIYMTRVLDEYNIGSHFIYISKFLNIVALVCNWAYIIYIIRQLYVNTKYSVRERFKKFIKTQ